MIPTGQNIGGVGSGHSSSSTRSNVRSEGGQNGIEQSNKGRSSNKPTPRVHTDGLACSHCGKSKHTRETCFKLNGYPDWWDELKARKQRDGTVSGTSGRAALAHAEPHLSLLSHAESLISPPVYGSALFRSSCNFGYALFNSTQGTSNGWILDLGATDHMTNYPTDLSSTTHPQRTKIANANGVTCPVTGARTVSLGIPLIIKCFTCSVSFK